MSFTLTDNQSVVITLGFADKKGNPTGPPAGAQLPVWMVDVPTVMSLTPAADGMSCVVAAVGPLGDATVSVAVADASGAALASGKAVGTVISEAPSQVVLNVGTPVENP